MDKPSTKRGLDVQDKTTRTRQFLKPKNLDYSISVSFVFSFEVLIKKKKNFIQFSLLLDTFSSGLTGLIYV